MFNLDSFVATRLGVITGGHHGVFPTADETKNATSTRLGEPKHGKCNPWDRARNELVQKLAELLDVEGKPSAPCNAYSMALAGLVTVVDWIASIDDEGFFPYAPDGPNHLDAYFRERRERARNVVKRLHWDACPRAPMPSSFKALFPHFEQPRPVQLAVEQVPSDRTLGLVIIEAPMGEGKTEAALFLAERSNAVGHRGSYIATPTQATSNQLYGRYKEFLTGRYGKGEKVNLQLLHGHASIDAELELLADGHVTPGPRGIDGNSELGEATVGAAEWFTYRKRGLLAPFGVGTIDQALLSVLQVRHGFVRLFGLAGKTVIIDEVHAYDTYMSTLLEHLLEWLAALGSPVVLLSATLPRAKRTALLHAYRRGLGAAAENLPFDPYPRITWATKSTVQGWHIETSSTIRRTLGITWLDAQGNQLPQYLIDQLRDGGCAAVVCNTVKRAQEVYVILREAFANLPDSERPELDLFHARFLYKDRQDRENRCLQRFGKPDQPDGTTAARPRQAVLVATQVIEQSLDLDFDVMVTEMAPIDLLLQRAGRLHRHERRDRRGPQKPVLQILAPENDEQGVPTFEPATTFVYDEHILLRTWQALRGLSSIAIPDDVEALIEAVYDEGTGPPDGAPEALAARWNRTYQAMQEKRRGQKALACQPLIPAPCFDPEEFLERPNAQLLEDRPEAASELRARTRLEQLPSVHVVWLGPDRESLADHETLQPTIVKAILRYSVELRGEWVRKLWAEGCLPRSWKAHSILRNYRLIVADEQYAVPDGPVLVLDKELGVVVRFLSSNEEVTCE